MDFEKQQTEQQRSQMQPEFQDVSLVDSGKEKNSQYSSAKSDWTQPTYDETTKKNPEDFFVATCESDAKTTATGLGKEDTLMKDAKFKGDKPLTGANGSKMAKTGTTLGGTENLFEKNTKEAKKKEKEIAKKEKDISKKDKDVSKDALEKDKDISKKDKDASKKDKDALKKDKDTSKDKAKLKGEERPLGGGNGSNMADATKIPLEKGKKGKGKLTETGGNGSKMADIKEAVGSTEFREDKDKTNRDINIGREQTGQRDIDANLLKEKEKLANMSQQKEGDLLNRQSK